MFSRELFFFKNEYIPSWWTCGTHVCLSPILNTLQSFSLFLSSSSSKDPIAIAAWPVRPPLLCCGNCGQWSLYIYILRIRLNGRWFKSEIRKDLRWEWSEGYVWLLRGSWKLHCSGEYMTFLCHIQILFDNKFDGIAHPSSEAPQNTSSKWPKNPTFFLTFFFFLPFLWIFPFLFTQPN